MTTTNTFAMFSFDSSGISVFVEGEPEEFF